MAKRPAKGKQLITLPKSPFDLEQISFNQNKGDQFVTSLGVTFIHYRAMPSPVGKKDRGDYRRSDSLDTISSNGFIYTNCGEFTGVILGNGKHHSKVEGGIFDHSTARLTLPRYYDESSPNNAGKEIRLCVGDRIYIKDLEVDVVNYQLVNHNPNGSDYLQYPALCVETLIDSDMNEYKEGINFKINRFGNIQWIDGMDKPNFDPETGEGRVYSIRYRYNAHWYIASIINEVRVTNVTEDGTRKPSRMPYHAMIQREYVYHNTANSEEEQIKKDKKPRHSPEPVKEIEEKKPKVRVNLNILE